MLSRLVITFLPRSKSLLMSWQMELPIMKEERTSTKCNSLENSCKHSATQSFTDLQNGSPQTPFNSEQTVPSDCPQGLLVGIATKLLLSKTLLQDRLSPHRSDT